VVPGLDGQKMSKSYGNYIAVFAPQKELKKRIMAVTTDATPLEDPKNPATCNVFALYKLFASADQQAQLAEKYRGGNYGYGHAKLELLALAEAHFAPQRERYEQLMARPGDLEDILAQGAQRARTVAHPVIERVREAVGLPRRPIG
jgi:tryptophanyl-tRNA synthetase